MGTMTEIREINRAATVALLAELGYDPMSVWDSRGDAVLEWDEEKGGFVLEVAELDSEGKLIREGDEFKTRTEHVTVTPERLAEYRRSLWRMGA